MGATTNLKIIKQSRRRHSRRSVPMSEINVTPFVDVMLVLLIIFMVAAPMLTVGVDVDLPKSAASALESENEEPLTITITKEGQIVLQTSTIPKEEEFMKKLCQFNSVHVYDGADFESNDIPKKGKSLMIFVSQSGETKDLHRCIQIEYLA